MPAPVLSEWLGSADPLLLLREAPLPLIKNPNRLPAWRRSCTVWRLPPASCSFTSWLPMAWANNSRRSAPQLAVVSSDIYRLQRMDARVENNTTFLMPRETTSTKGQLRSILHLSLWQQKTIGATRRRSKTKLNSNTIRTTLIPSFIRPAPCRCFPNRSSKGATGPAKQTQIRWLDLQLMESNLISKYFLGSVLVTAIAGRRGVAALEEGPQSENC
jgi:hypothetical protein